MTRGHGFGSVLVSVGISAVAGVRAPRGQTPKRRRSAAPESNGEPNLNTRRVDDLTAMTCLYELSTRLHESSELRPLLEEVLRATVALQNSDFGTLQLYRPTIEQLEIVAQRGFDPEKLKAFAFVGRSGASSCARALRLGRRVIFDDIERDGTQPAFRSAAAQLGFRAQTSTPLFSRRGNLLGMMTTHFRAPHRPSRRDLRFTDLYARQAAQAIERQHTDEALRTRDERFRRYFELGLIGMATTSPTKGIVEVNDEMCRILGYPREELLQKTWAEMTHPDDLAADEAQFERVMAGEIDGYSLEKRWVRKDGEIVHGVMSARCKRRADGSVDYFVGLLLDITERKRAEERLRRSEAYLAHAERLSHTGSWALNIETGELFWSEEHFRIVGLDSAMGTPAYPLALNVIHPDDRLFVVEALERAMREKSEFDTHCRVVRPDGTVRFIRSNAQPVFNRAGEVSEYVGSIVDITEAKQAEEKIAESERRFRLLAETLPQHVWTYDRNGNATYFNQRWLDYTGMAREEARGTGGHGIVHSDDMPALEAVWRQANAARKPFECEVRLRNKSGEYRRVVVRGAPFFSDTGEVLEWHGTNTDVEDRRRAEEELEKTQQELAVVTQITAMAEMAAAIAHEINQPLGAIVNNSNYCLGLLGQPEAEKKKRAALQDIVADANRASAIIQRIRGLTNGSTYATMTLDFAELIEEVINLCQRPLTEHRIKVTRAVAKNLPRFRGDRVQIQQVLFNLVTNAIEAMRETEEGVLSIRVTRGKLERNPAILLTVTDNGVGFAPEMTDKMFEAFYTTKNGMGMGLRISRSIAEKYGGPLTARPNKDRGATFSFLLPADEPA